MNTQKFDRFLTDFGMPILLILAGVMLLTNPGGATYLVTKLVGWLLVIPGALMLIRPALKSESIPSATWMKGGLLILLGVLILANPGLIADNLVRFFGILLAIEGFRSLRAGGKLLPILTIAAGVALVLLPRAIAHTILSVGGIVMIVIGVINALSRLKSGSWLTQKGDTNIIDADQ